MGDTSLYGNRGLTQIGRRGQGCARSMSKPYFQIPRRDLPFVARLRKAIRNASLLCPPLPGDAAAHTPGPARRTEITISPALLTLPLLPIIVFQK
jgi:hypothetical protein